MPTLINPDFFIGELDIPNTDDTDIAAGLQAIINRREPELLEKMLGYGLFKVFSAGISEISPAQRWIDLLYGKEYTDSKSILRKWRGILEQAVGFTYIPPTGISTIEDIWLKVTGDAASIPIDADHAITPAQDTFELASLKGKKYRVVHKGEGPLIKDVQYSEIDDGGFTLLGGKVFELNDDYFIQFILQNTVLDSPSGDDDLKKSMLANFIYYWISRDNASQTTTTGEVKTKSVNANIADPAIKQVRAFNEGREMLGEMWRFLDNNTTIYPEWGGVTHEMLIEFAHINTMNL